MTGGRDAGCGRDAGGGHGAGFGRSAGGPGGRAGTGSDGVTDGVTDGRARGRRRRAEAAPAPAPGAIVILGARVREDGRPSPALLRRTRAGLRLWRAGAAPLVLVTGGLGAPGRPSEAACMAAILREAGVPQTAILSEPRARSTEENAVFSARLLRARGIGRVALVSDALHLPRARLCFARAGIACRGAPADADGPRRSLRARAASMAREAAALLRCLLGPPALRARRRRRRAARRNPARR